MGKQRGQDRVFLGSAIEAAHNALQDGITEAGGLPNGTGVGCTLLRCFGKYDGGAVHRWCPLAQSAGMAFSPQRLSSSMITCTPVLPRCAGSNPFRSRKSHAIAPRASSE